MPGNDWIHKQNGMKMRQTDYYYKEGQDWLFDPIKDYGMDRKLRWLMSEYHTENSHLSSTPDPLESPIGQELLALGSKEKLAKKIVHFAVQYGWSWHIMQFLTILWNESPEIPHEERGRFGNVVFRYMEMAKKKDML